MHKRQKGVNGRLCMTQSGTLEMQVGSLVLLTGCSSQVAHRVATGCSKGGQRLLIG